VHQGVIEALLPVAEAERRYRADKTIDLPNQVLMPGLVNAHGHSAMCLLRGYADDLPLNDWLENHIWPAESQWISEAFVRDGTRHAIAEMIRSGTTCFSDTYFFPEVAVDAAVNAGIRMRAAFPVLEFPTAWGRNADEYIHKGLTLRDDYKNHELINVAFGPHAPYTVEDKTFERIAMLSEELDAHIHLHLHEAAKEVEDSLKLHAMRPVERMEKLGILGPRTETVHMTQLIESDIELLARYNSSVIHCPKSNMKLASGICPIARLRDAGIQLALGTDGAASNNRLDMFSELNTASLLAKVSSMAPTCLSAFDALRMATLGGARIMGLDDKIGSLEVGKKADMISVQLDTINSQPLYQVVSQLVYASESSQVTNSWVDGQLLMDNGKLSTIPEQELLAISREWANRISGRT
jgi:5-methylthioadenosine/S-adenosylhomocysteine deaminase